MDLEITIRELGSEGVDIVPGEPVVCIIRCHVKNPDLLSQLVEGLCKRLDEDIHRTTESGILNILDDYHKRINPQDIEETPCQNLS